MSGTGFVILLLIGVVLLGAVICLDRCEFTLVKSEPTHGIYGHNELARESTRYAARPAFRFFDHTLLLGEEEIVIELIDRWINHPPTFRKDDAA